MAPIKKVLIANRGEIALRVMKACKEQGLETVAVYSDADAGAPYVRAADASVRIGPAQARESYLNVDKIINAARLSNANAIHPGYGFLSENSEFAARCEKEGITFIGPTSESIAKMGSKIGAKELLKTAAPDIPLIPGYQGADQSIDTLINEASKVGYPILVKASAGGGGKGMRIVREPADLRGAIEGAKREAKSAFGDESLLIERYFEDVRHIEVQIIGDKHGTVIHCFERECSIQRRHQKVIEETPSMAITDKQRHTLGYYAVTIGKSLNYVGLGTVEFIMDNASSKFYFLEVNTRLQVEHPITEAVTGLDLVRIQLQMAMGESLVTLNIAKPGILAANVTQRGHAIEARLCAEDASQGFVPCAGRIAAWRAARSSSAFEFQSSGVRYDAGYGTGSEVSIYYDNLLAKVIAYGATRQEAARKLDVALQETVVLGIDTNLPLLRAILSHPAFLSGRVNTHFLQTHKEVVTLTKDAVVDRDLAIVAMVWSWLVRENARTLLRHVPSAWRGGPRRYLKESFGIDKEQYDVEYHAVHQHNTTNHKPQTFHVRVGGSELDVTLCGHAELPGGVYELDMEIGTQQQRYTVTSPATPTSEDRYHEPQSIYIHNIYAGNRTLITVPRFPAALREDAGDVSQNAGAASHAGAATQGIAGAQGRYCAPMPGKVVRVCVRAGDTVKAGAPLVVMEAMKMENTINAAAAGKVVSVAVKEGDVVNVKALLVEVQKE